MFQQTVFIARIQNLLREDKHLQEQVDNLMQWANTDEKVRRLVEAMLREKERWEALNGGRGKA